ncbi:BlaI/MecI/CopY family transcriptional regulator [Compostibacter hankyongensis]|uniref:BlaI/MecI/CopY family transcriptional regulator n=1 Tax=Compostibacter hankyongensis TaxID=1007089 RepID=A0ABP8FPW6_9BACT
MAADKHPRPTESELEILQVLWERGPSTVREVHEVLARQKETGYTTTLKLMQIMHDKGTLRRDTSARTHIYEASVSREDTQHQLLDRMIHTLFSGSAASLVMQTLGHHRASAGELEKIKDYLQQLERSKK